MFSWQSFVEPLTENSQSWSITANTAGIMGRSSHLLFDKYYIISVADWKNSRLKSLSWICNSWKYLWPDVFLVTCRINVAGPSKWALPRSPQGTHSKVARSHSSQPSNVPVPSETAHVLRSWWSTIRGVFARQSTLLLGFSTNNGQREGATGLCATHFQQALRPLTESYFDFFIFYPPPFYLNIWCELLRTYDEFWDSSRAYFNRGDAGWDEGSKMSY